MTIPRILASATFAALASASALAQVRAQVPDWSVREELRISDGTSTGKLPDIARLVVGRDGRVYGLSDRGVISVFDRSGRLLRLQTTATSRELDTLLRERMESRRRERPERGGASRHLFSDLRSAGRPGGFGWVGDTLWIALDGAAHVALYSASADTIGRIAFSARIAGHTADVPLALLPDGSLLRTITSPDEPQGAPSVTVPPRAGVYRMPIIPGPPLPPDDEETARGYLLRATPSGTVIQGLEIFIEPRKPVVMRNPYGVTATFPHPFQDHPLIAVTPDGSEIVFVERYEAGGRDGASYSVARFDTRTGKRTARRYAHAPVPVTRADEDNVITALIDGDGGAITPQFLEAYATPAAARAAIRRSIGGAGFHAPVTDVVAGADRTVWLREHASGRWIVLGRDGGVLGRVSLPAGMRLLHADSDTAWAITVRASGLGQPQGTSAPRALVRYRIAKPSA